MAQHQTLHAEKRQRTGSNSVNQVRREGFVPGVIYGSNLNPISLKVSQKNVSELLHDATNENILVNLSIEGDKKKSRLALIQGVQHDTISGEIRHIDFHAVKEDEIVTASVPIELHGEAIGVKEGGILDHQILALEVRCLPSALPEKLEAEVSELTIGQAIHVGDLKLPEGVEAVLDGEVVVALVSEVKVAASAEEDEQATPTDTEADSEEESTQGETEASGQSEGDGGESS